MKIFREGEGVHENRTKTLQTTCTVLPFTFLCKATQRGPAMLNNGCYACSEVQAKWLLQNYYTSVLYAVQYYLTMFTAHTVVSSVNFNTYTFQLVHSLKTECLCPPCKQNHSMWMCKSAYSFRVSSWKLWHVHCIHSFLPIQPIQPECRQQCRCCAHCSARDAAFGRRRRRQHCHMFIILSQSESTWVHQSLFRLTLSSPFSHS